MITGYRYAEMGYTACFEPAMLPANARQAHMEMGDTPMLDKGAFVMLGSDDFMLRQIAAKHDFEAIKDYIAWTMHAAQAIAVKVVNPGGISAFKFNQRKLDLDEKHVYYGITPRDIILTLARGAAGARRHASAARARLQPRHPRQRRDDARHHPRDGRPAAAPDAHPVPQLRHRGRPSILLRRGAHAELVNKYPEHLDRRRPGPVRPDLHGLGRQHAPIRASKNAHPKRTVVMDIECDAGCGVVPMRYRDKSYVNALQWAIGLETFLLVEDPWRIFLTTDHPNGAPFYTYPHLIRLLMDRGFRNDMMQRINPDAAAIQHAAHARRASTRSTRSPS